MEIEVEEIEAVLERIWDLHDKISDAIHGVSRAHFLRSVKSFPKSPPKEAASLAEHESEGRGKAGGISGGGFVFVKDFRAAEDEGDAAIEEMRSLNAIRTALENLEDQLEFFHTIHSQQQVERDAAMARLEQSRIILSMRLADHQGKRYKVIEEALEFVSEAQDKRNFITPESLYGIPRNQSGHKLTAYEVKTSNVLLQTLISSLAFAKHSFKCEWIRGLLGNAAIFSVSILAILQINQAAFNNESKQMQVQPFHRKRNIKRSSRPGHSFQSCQVEHFDVLSARG